MGEAACEMNKFISMMRLLGKRAGGFSHLVVADASFEVFRRAWCIAEIVESSCSGVSQRIMLHSTAAVDLHYGALADLDVRRCEASLAEDKDMILSAIDDIGAFNTQLQWAIFGTEGLLTKWVDGQERAALVARFLQRAARERCSGWTGDSSRSLSLISDTPEQLDSTISAM